jgi:endonuclease/exonuclease/phosphatase family metal-dependent hydrolase
MRINETAKMWISFIIKCQMRVKKTPRNDALILLGDFNAKIEKEHSNKRVEGRHTLHNITSENGEKQVQLAIAHILEMSSTKYQHRRIHKDTWKAPG